MKRGILLATLMVTAAGVASASLLTTAPPGVVSPQGVAAPKPQAQLPAVPPPLIASMEKSDTDKRTAQPAPAKVASVQTTQKSPVETQQAQAQAPVPFKMKPRPPVDLPPAADKATDVKTTDKPADASGDPAATDGSGENAARAAIEADGYKSVKVLRKGAGGIWHASALRGKTTVMLTVDANGSVSAD